MCVGVGVSFLFFLFFGQSRGKHLPVLLVHFYLFLKDTTFVFCSLLSFPSFVFVLFCMSRKLDCVRLCLLSTFDHTFHCQLTHSSLVLRMDRANSIPHITLGVFLSSMPIHLLINIQYPGQTEKRSLGILLVYQYDAVGCVK